MTNMISLLSRVQFVPHLKQRAKENYGTGGYRKECMGIAGAQVLASWSQLSTILPFEESVDNFDEILAILWPRLVQEQEKGFGFFCFLPYNAVSNSCLFYYAVMTLAHWISQSYHIFS